MWGAVEERYYRIDDVANMFLASEYNNVCFDGSDLPLLVKSFVLSHSNERKMGLSDDYIQDVSKSLLKKFQRQIRYRFDD